MLYKNDSMITTILKVTTPVSYDKKKFKKKHFAGIIQRVVIKRIKKAIQL